MAPLIHSRADMSRIFDKLVVVTANAVYKGGKSCVEKPTTKKRLDDNDHLSKVSHHIGGGGGVTCSPLVRFEIRSHF